MARLRTVLGDREPGAGHVYAHEHLIIDSPLIEDRFPHIHLADVPAAVAEVTSCREAGAAMMVDCMPCASGRDPRRLAAIARESGVDVIAATGLHHDRYYGPRHWSNHLNLEELAELFVADLVEGIDAFDYTSPVVRRTPHRAGVIKVATSGEFLDARDRRNLTAAALAHRRTGAPILTHCEGGRGALTQIELLADLGVRPEQVITSHVDKTGDLAELRAIAETGATVECDQALRQHAQGAESPAVDLLVGLVSAGHAQRIVVGTDGARRSLWNSLGGGPGLAWLSHTLPRLLGERGVEPAVVSAILGDNARRVLAWADD